MFSKANIRVIREFTLFKFLHTGSSKMCLVEKPESKDISGRPRRRWEYNTETNVSEVDYKRVCTQLSDGRF
jgi:hypothetical protein